MTNAAAVLKDLVDANRILAHEGVVDAFGHVSVRHPDRPDRYLLSCSRSPELVTEDDIIEFHLDGRPVDDTKRTLYSERPIHGAVYEARPEIISVVHNHSNAVIPFSVTQTPLKPLTHTAAGIGEDIPVWDIRDNFGVTDLLVTTMEQGRDLARNLGGGAVTLMRGHGCVVTGQSIQDAVVTAIYLQVNADLQMQALRLGEVKYLDSGEIDAIRNSAGYARGFLRAWEYLRSRAGRPTI